MKILILSDLHNEFDEFNLNCVDADILILAGDTHLGIGGIKWLNTLDLNIPVIYVLGNHEYYKNAYPKLIKKLKEVTRNPNIHILEDEKVEIEDICFHGTTLWTDFKLYGNPKLGGILSQQKMTDYRKIRFGPLYSKLRSINVAQIHKNSAKWLENSLKTSSSIKNIVVTHHAPSIKSIPMDFQDDLVSSAYASNLEPLIKQTAPDIWIHGHLHTSFDYKIDKTRIICNPRGYSDEFNENFDPELIVEI